ncbi:hypothetical protein [Viridibacillus arvi]|uniref:hypothetical protein n=1 Tax=Viridibacillus arvi TaxID=263475 RepID=UPI0034CD61B9
MTKLNLLKEIKVLLATIELLEFFEELARENEAFEEELKEERVYSSYQYTSNDEPLLQAVLKLQEIGNALGSEHKLYKMMFKSVANFLREDIGLDCVLGLGVNKVAGEVVIDVYEELKATEGSHYPSGYDKVLGKPYLIVNENN